MKKRKFSEAQIFAILNQGESGAPVAELCREQRCRAQFITLDAANMMV